MSKKSKQPAELSPMEVPPGAYAVVQHHFNKRGKVESLSELTAFALLVDEEGCAVGAMTALGSHRHVPLTGPCGEVTLVSESGKATYWPDMETYKSWAQQHFN